jgi:hypothetical protein
MKKEYEDWFYNQFNFLPYEKNHGVGFTNVDELLSLRKEFRGYIMEGGVLEISKEERKEQLKRLKVITFNEYKFLKKNEKNIIKLNSFIDLNKNDIELMIVSVEMFLYLQLFDKCETISDTLILYDGVRVFSLPYASSNRVNLIKKSDTISFDVPCVCGIYSDEPHNHLK